MKHPLQNTVSQLLVFANKPAATMTTLRLGGLNSGAVFFGFTNLFYLPQEALRNPLRVMQNFVSSFSGDCQTEFGPPMQTTSKSATERPGLQKSPACWTPCPVPLVQPCVHRLIMARAGLDSYYGSIHLAFGCDLVQFQECAIRAKLPTSHLFCPSGGLFQTWQALGSFWYFLRVPFN